MARRIYHVVDGGEHTPAPEAVPPQPTQGVPVPELRPAFQEHPTTWKGFALIVAMTALTGAGGIIGSHIKGVTEATLDAKLEAHEKRLEEKFRAALAAESTALQKHFVEAISMAPIYNPPKPVRRAKKTTNEQEK